MQSHSIGHKESVSDFMILEFLYLSKLNISTRLLHIKLNTAGEKSLLQRYRLQSTAAGGAKLKL
jgi:hypothetical protein